MEGSKCQEKHYRYRYLHIIYWWLVCLSVRLSVCSGYSSSIYKPILKLCIGIPMEVAWPRKKLVKISINIWDNKKICSIEYFVYCYLSFRHLKSVLPNRIFKHEAMCPSEYDINVLTRSILITNPKGEHIVWCWWPYMRII